MTATLKSTFAEVWVVLSDNAKPFFLAFVLSVVAILPYTIEVVLEADNYFDFHERFLVISAGFFLLSILSRKLFVLACTVVLVFTVLQLHLDYHWGGDQLDSRVEVFLESPPAETYEYFQSHLNRFDAAVFLLAAVFVFFLVRFLRVDFSHRTQLRKLALLATAAWCGIFLFLKVYEVRRIFAPYNIPRVYIAAKARVELLTTRRNTLSSNPLLAKECDSPYEKIVIVLGESMVTDHLSAFGYRRKTTPFVDKSNPLKIAAISPSNQTRTALAMMLTDAEPGNFDIFYESHSVIGELRACGYESLWVSNQGQVGKFDSYSTSLAVEADSQKYLNDLSYRSAQNDWDVVTRLREDGIPSIKNLVTVIHLIGSHTKYNNRYPKGFGFNDVHDNIDAYDNSVLFTDYVLSQIHHDFYSDKTLILYLSDHGQVVSNGFHGSGFSPGYKEEYRIPLLVWSEDKDKLGSIANMVEGERMNASSLPNLIRYLVGIIPDPALSTSDEIYVLGTQQRDIKRYSNLDSFDAGD